MMGNCKDCKFWDHFWQNHRTEMATCDAFGYMDINTKADVGAAFDLRLLDDTGLIFDFKTGPNFGCVKFQPREEVK